MCEFERYRRREKPTYNVKYLISNVVFIPSAIGFLPLGSYPSQRQWYSDICIPFIHVQSFWGGFSNLEKKDIIRKDQRKMERGRAYRGQVHGVTILVNNS